MASYRATTNTNTALNKSAVALYIANVLSDDLISLIKLVWINFHVTLQDSNLRFRLDAVVLPLDETYISYFYHHIECLTISHV